jgi:glycosyltransferase involved in cell wall biosynthesis
MKLFLDISPLQENSYTGVPAVTEQLALTFLEGWHTDVVFFWENFAIPKDVIRSVLEMRDGRYFLEIIRNMQHVLPTVTSMAKWDDVVFFTNRGFYERITSKQCQFIHDLTTVIFPETHHRDAVYSHTQDFIHATRNIDLFLCNSECTKEDVSLYLGIPDERIKVALLGFKYPDHIPEVTISERYICILGTFEPRKNNMIILEMLSRFPDWMDNYRFVFVGRFGWGPDIKKVFDSDPIIKNAVNSKRIVFSGFLSETDKWIIINNASCTIYASLYEGFGLPIIESLACYTPVVSSFSSSLPEVGGKIAEYFDPFDAVSLDLALRRCFKRISVDKNKYDVHLKQFSWDGFRNKVKHELEIFMGYSSSEAIKD